MSGAHRGSVGLTKAASLLLVPLLPGFFGALAMNAQRGRFCFCHFQHHVFVGTMREMGAACFPQEAAKCIAALLYYFFLPEAKLGCHPAVFWLGAAAIVLIFCFLGFLVSRLPLCSPLAMSVSFGVDDGVLVGPHRQPRRTTTE
jgi:hypothetical protein